MDRAKKAAARPPEPAAPPPATAPPGAEDIGDWRLKLHAALVELGMQFTADAVENSRVVESGGELQFLTTPAYKLALRPDDLNKALKQITSRPLRVKVMVGDVGVQAPAVVPAKATEDEATSRALANPEVQRFRDVFGGEVRKVRNLKE
jgi:hypothetical protein